ncbi:hypothetical protein ACFSUD_11875 [Sulfitobacter aestuarii]|uniref:Uncharacterized protein n=1 Tax=Sulfitobacter aestuarii TaxID=2161676 RepID=A0ABW5U398_9RHOB
MRRSKKPFRPGRNSSHGADWIILTAAALGCAIVLIASIHAGDRGLAAHLGSYISPTRYF